MKSLYILSLIFVLSSCAGSSLEKACEGRNWKSLGYEDGMKGNSQDKALEVKKVCMKKGIEVSIVEYKEGWLEGISKYCSSQNAYLLGRKDEDANSESCPIEMRTVFQSQYQKGKTLHKLNEEMSEMDEDLADLKDDEKDLYETIISKKNKLNDLKSKINRLAEKKSELRTHIESIKEKSE